MHKKQLEKQGMGTGNQNRNLCKKLYGQRRDDCFFVNIFRDDSGLMASWSKTSKHNNGLWSHNSQYSLESVSEMGTPARIDTA